MTVKISKPALNLREKLSELDKPSGIAGQDILKAETPQEVFSYIGAGRRNWIINGDFQVSQRGDYTSLSNAATNTYYADRWKTYLSGVTGQKVRNLNGYDTGKPSYKIQASSTGNAAFGITQVIEDYSTAAGYTFTFSAWVKSNKDNARLILGDSSSWFASSEAHSGNGSWEKLQVTALLDKTTTSFSVSARVSSGNGQAVSVTSGDYIELAQVQLEVGSVATPFEHRSYGEELVLCQRYFERVSLADRHQGKLHGVDQAHFTYPYRVKKRATPTLSNGTCTSIYDGATTYTDASVTFSAKDHDGINQESVTYRIITGTSMGTPVYRNVAGYGLGFDIDAEL
jgi:hypothetical protein